MKNKAKSNTAPLPSMLEPLFMPASFFCLFVSLFPSSLLHPLQMQAIFPLFFSPTTHFSLSFPGPAWEEELAGVQAALSIERVFFFPPSFLFFCSLSLSFFFFVFPPPFYKSLCVLYRRS